MDKKDCSILDLLQTDATLSISEVSERIGLSATACWKRIQRLTEEGFLRKQVWLLDSEKLGLGLTVFVSVKTRRHEPRWILDFCNGVRDFAEVLEFYRMTGDADYLLKIVVQDISGFDLFYKKLIQSADLLDVSSSFAMEQIKCTTALPLACQHA